MTVHVVLRGDGHRGVAAGKGIGGGGEIERLAQSEHGENCTAAKGHRDDPHYSNAAPMSRMMPIRLQGESGASSPGTYATECSVPV
jgi:hypothetical protein